MINKTILIVVCSLFLSSLFSYGIEQISITFVDHERDNRQIPTQIFLPVEDEPGVREENSFPFIVFGHGWISPYSLYQQVWEALVPQGWIMVFPTTEGGLFPNHQEFALDIAFLSHALPLANEDPASALFEKVDSLSVAMGHSMGGGCSILAASGHHNFSSVVTLAAAATTNPSAIDAAGEVLLPSLTFAGTSDTITPPANHQLPIYQNLASVYKGYISLNNVGHLAIYANQTVFSLIGYWLGFIQSGELHDLMVFEDLLEFYLNEEILTYLIENNFTEAETFTDAPLPEIYVFNYPNPFNPDTVFSFSISRAENVRLAVYNVRGQKVNLLTDDYYLPGTHQVVWDASQHQTGVYFYRMKVGDLVRTGKCLLLK